MVKTNLPSVGICPSHTPEYARTDGKNIYSLFNLYSSWNIICKFSCQRMNVFICLHHHRLSGCENLTENESKPSRERDLRQTQHTNHRTAQYYITFWKTQVSVYNDILYASVIISITNIMVYMQNILHTLHMLFGTFLHPCLPLIQKLQQNK